MHDARAGARRGSKEPGPAGAMLRPPPAPMMYKIPEVMVMLRMSRHAMARARIPACERPE